jgi:putative CocE/NonD family hydrolase
MSFKRICGLAIALSCLASAAAAQGVAVPGPLKRDDPQLAQTMAGIAVQALDSGAVATPDDRFRLQLAAGRYAEAVASLAQIRQGRPASDPALLLNLRWEIYARARAAEGRGGVAFPAAFAAAAAETLQQVDGLTAYKVLYSLGTPLGVMDDALDRALQAQAGRSSVDAPAAAALARAWLGDSAYRAFHDILPSVTDADDARRYVVQLDAPLRTPDGATVCAHVIRPRTAARLPALLNFSIYADRAVKLDDARITAAHGYAAVMGFTRGKACSPDAPVPAEHDGADADAVIEWIAAQPWSDGRVGMYGGSYDGFTQWAASKHPPKALKAIMPSVSFSPGTDFPMEGNIGLTYAFPWPFYTTDDKAVDDATYFDDARWDRLQRTWYREGRAYRDLDKIDGKPNPVFDGWLRHPAFDAYWQGLVPSDEELRRLDIPVLTTTGYYDSGQIGALSYLLRRERLNPKAEQYLVVGPYQHHTGQLGTITPLGSAQPEMRGYHLDPVAQLDIIALRYAWFDYVLKGAPKPAILADRANYQVMGANVWKHAASIAGIGARTRRFYLSARAAPGGHALTDAPGAPTTAVVQLLDLADRRDVDRFSPHGPLIDQTLDDWPIVSKAPNLANAIAYVSAPFARPPEISGLFSGRLDFAVNKRDVDVAVTLFELTAQGEYFQLSYAWRRASYARDRSRRQLLTPGRRTAIDFTAGRLTSRQFQPGSRLVVVLNLFKQPGEQINYGSGKPVSDETLADAGPPLKVRWFADSYLDVPIAP